MASRGGRWHGRILNTAAGMGAYILSDRALVEF